MQHYRQPFVARPQFFLRLAFRRVVGRLRQHGCLLVHALAQGGDLLLARLRSVRILVSLSWPTALTAVPPCGQPAAPSGRPFAVMRSQPVSLPPVICGHLRLTGSVGQSSAVLSWSSRRHGICFAPAILEAVEDRVQLVIVVQQ
jgi:hypothetical protein